MIQGVLEVSPCSSYIVKHVKDKSIQYAFRYESQQLMAAVTNLIHLTQKFRHFTVQYEIKVAPLNEQILQARHMMMGYDHFLKTHFQDYKITGDIVTNAIVEINSMVQQTKSSINTNLSSTAETFESTLNNMVDNILQDVYVASEEAHNTMIENRDEIVKNCISHLQQEADAYSHPTPLGHTSTTPVTSTRFPNVRLEPTYRKSPNPFEANVDNVTQTHHHADANPAFQRSPQNINATKSLPDIGHQHGQPTFSSNASLKQVPRSVNVQLQNGDIPALNHN